MILEEINEKDDNAFDMREYMYRIQRNLLQLCFVHKAFPDELEKVIGKFRIIGDNRSKKAVVINAMVEGCKFFNIKDYDSFYEMNCISETDIINRIDELCKDTIDGRLVWKKQDSVTFKTYDLDFYLSSKSLLKVSKCRFLEDYYSLDFKGKANAPNKFDYRISESDNRLSGKMKELYELAIELSY